MACHANFLGFGLQKKTKRFYPLLDNVEEVYVLATVCLALTKLLCPWEHGLMTSHFTPAL